MPGERNYHIFYQILSKYAEKWHESLLLKPDPALYSFINQGELVIDGVDDSEEMKITDEAFDVLGFTNDEKMSLFKSTASILNLGQIKFKQRPREDQAECDGTTDAEKVAFLLGVNAKDLSNAFLRPIVKVGNDHVTKGQNLDQVLNAISALAKSLYNRMFNWLVQRVNKTLDTKVRRQYFIGVLDIAGFEIFQENGFEQICINYTNERLQQFFNHHMFILEQDEYRKENISWTFIDFGLDLQACIDLIEKPMGILSILEEECMFPKASDQTLKEKLYENHLGKSPNFSKPKPLKGCVREAHFELKHYAGTLPYNISGWLEKNKDPVNECVVSLLETSKESLISQLFASSNDQSLSGKKRKSGSFMTVSYVHRESLNKLMKNLHSTSPHFIRCIVPNEMKEPGSIDPQLVLHQLHCNGVLEGIRICRKGYPNRMVYSEFKQRYSILAPDAIPKGFMDGKIVTEKILTAIQIDTRLYQCGNTKVFFKAGTLAELEEMRDEKIGKLISLFQAQIRGYIMRRKYNILLDQRTALSLIQRNIRKYLILRTWPWWKLFTKIKPLLNVARQEDEVKKALDDLNRLRAEFEKLEKLKKSFEEQNVTLLQQKNSLFIQLQAEQDNLADAEEKFANILHQKAYIEQQLKDIEERLREKEMLNVSLNEEKVKYLKEIDELKKDVEDLESSLQKAEQEKIQKDLQIKTLQEEMLKQDDEIRRITKIKLKLDESFKKLEEELHREEEKNDHLTKINLKLESAFEETQNSLDREKKLRSDVEKSKRRIEQDLKLSQTSFDALDKSKASLEEILSKKDIEIGILNGKLEDEENVIAALQRKIKELQNRIQELEEDLDAEKMARMKVEKSKSQVQSELDELNEKLEEQGDQTDIQIELNKRREGELLKLKQDLEEQRSAHEQQMIVLRKKQTDTSNELLEEVEKLKKSKLKSENEAIELKRLCEQLNRQIDVLNKGKVNSERIIKSLEGQISDLSQKCEDYQTKNEELIREKINLKNENIDISEQIKELEAKLCEITRLKAQISAQFDESNLRLDEEIRAKNKLLGDVKRLNADLDYLRDSLEEEQTSKSELQKVLQKTYSELNTFKSKDNKDDIKVEELEEIKRRYNQKIAEHERENLEVKSRCAQLEKSKSRLQGEVEDLMIDIERAHATASQLEKKQKVFDKTLSDYVNKYQDIKNDLEESNKCCRDYSTENFRLKTQIEEFNEQIESLRRENKNLSEEKRELNDQISEEGKSLYEASKVNKRFEVEREELQNALEEAEKALEQEEAKVQHANLEISRLKKEVENKLAEREEEFETTRKNHQKVIESMQITLDAETNRKNEAMRIKKTLESEKNELEAALESCNRSRGEQEKSCQKHLSQISELENKIEELERTKDDLEEKRQNVERKNNHLVTELKDLKVSLECSEKTKKSYQLEKEEILERINDLTEQLSTMKVEKKRIETDLNLVMGSLDEANIEIKQAEEKVKKSMSESARLFEEIHQEQDNSLQLERSKKFLELKVKELEARLEENEVNQVKSNRKLISKLEQKCHDLENELGSERKRNFETERNMKKSERKLRDVSLQAEEEKLAHEKLVDLVSSMQTKIKAYKRQIEEAEELAAVNLTKYRKLVHEVEQADERADQAEQALQKFKAKTRSSSRAGEPTTNLINSNLPNTKTHKTRLGDKDEC